MVLCDTISMRGHMLKARSRRCFLANLPTSAHMGEREFAGKPFNGSRAADTRRQIQAFAGE